MRYLYVSPLIGVYNILFFTLELALELMVKFGSGLLSWPVPYGLMPSAPSAEIRHRQPLSLSPSSMISLTRF